MTIKTLLAAAAATALMTGAAHAQLGAGASGTAQGEVTNQSQPADAKDAQTGLPSVDMTRPTGQDAGKTNMPNGTVSGEPATDATSAGSNASSTESMGGEKPAVNDPGATSSTSGVTTDPMASPSSSTSAAGSMGAAATTGTASDTSATMTTTTATNGPVADTPENRAKYKPLSRAGRATSARGN